MRYVEQKSVADVLGWLEKQDCKFSRRAFHQFMIRVLRLMSLDLANKMGVDSELLRRVRIRLKMPVDPQRKVATSGKHTQRYDSRRRRRQLLPVRKPKPVSPSVVRPSHLPQPGLARQVPLAGITADIRTSSAVINNPDDEEGYCKLRRLELIAINKLAHEKVLAQTSDLILNYQGTVIHLYSRHEYTPRELQDQYGLTYAEAHTCFLSLD